jgi:hypothetical protein
MAKITVDLQLLAFTEIDLLLMGVQPQRNKVENSNIFSCKMQILPIVCENSYTFGTMGDFS